MLLTRTLDREPCRSLGDYVSSGGGRAIDAARRVAPATLIDEVDASGLRGRGGGGFPTGRKWRTVAQASGRATPTVVVNGAEGEPGTFKDRMLLRTNPYKVIEGALVAAHAIGAAEVVIAVKASFEREVAALERAVAEMDAAGFPGSVESRPVELSIVRGPDAYLFGEETALLEVVAGRQPFPRVAPPYRRGLDDRSDAAGGAAAAAELAVEGVETVPATLVNNVETLANIPAIVVNGADEFRRLGTVDSPGTIVCTISGQTARDGVGEVEMGTSLGAVIDHIGGGATADRELVGALSGAANPIVPAALFDTPLTYEDMEHLGSGLGAAGFVVYDDRSDVVAVAQGVARFLAVESCGQCEPCKRDGLALADLLDDLCRSAPTSDLDEIESRLRTVTDGARCTLAAQQQRVVGSVLSLFPHLAGSHAAGEVAPSAPVPCAPIREIRDGRVVLDETQLSKQPDWSHDDPPSGTWPAASLGDVPVASPDRPG